jgi:MYXO-CTERM domain-containing protein
MIRCPSTRFGKLLVGAAALALASACTELPIESGEAASDGSLVGELTAYMVDYENENRSEVLHKLLQPSGTERTLLFSTVPDLEPGTKLKVWASEEGDALRVLRYEAFPEPVELQQQPLVMGTPKPTRRWAFVLVNFGNGVNTTEQAITPRLFDAMTAGSIRSYFREVSYGLQDLDGEVFSFTTTANGACDTGVTRLRAMIPGQFSQYLWYFGQRQAGCGWAGLAQLGSATRPSRDSWYNASNGCVVLVQEPGHNFGMVHSSAITCTRNGTRVPLTLPNEAGATCAHNEYGNPFDPMGRGCYHMNGPQKAYQDWLSGCNVVKVGSSGTFTVFPIEKACNGVQLLQVPLPAPRTMRIGTLSAVITSYYLELRTPVGFDFKPNAAGNLTPRVLVTIGGDVRGAGQAGGRNWLIDMTPETPMSVTDSALPVGRQYVDPAEGGPKFTVVSADMEKAVIKIELSTGGGSVDAPGTGVCDGNAMMPFTAPGPETCNAAPATPAAPATDAGAPPAVTPDASPPPPPSAPDAGVTGGIDNPGGGGPPPAPAPAPSGGGTPPAPSAPSAMTPVAEPIEAGCSCRTAPGPSSSGTILLGGLFAAAMLLRRRRR